MAKILVVDDDERVLDAVVLTLHRLGHEVEAFRDAQPAIDGVDFSCIDLAIVDRAMPTPGERLIEHIRRQYCLPIIVITGYLEDGARSSLESLGVDRIVAKPFMPTELFSVVESLLTSA